MLSTTHRRIALASALLTTSILAGAMPASADVGKLKSMSFSTYNATQELHVISKDGKTWNAFKSGNIPFSANLGFDSKGTGYVHRAGVVLGACGGNSCKSFPRLWSNHLIVRDWSYNSAPFIFAAQNIPLGDADSIAVMPEGGQILARCNDKLTANGPTKSHSFMHTMAATFAVETDKDTNINNNPIEVGDSSFPHQVHHWRTDTFQVKVVCDAVFKAPTNDVAAPQPDFKSTDVKLFLATINGVNTDGPNPATKCPALRVTTRVQTTKAGGVDVRIWRKQGNGQATSTFKSAYASYDAAKNGYFADFVSSEKFDATTYLQFMAEVVGGTFAPSTQWKDITVLCTGAGGGGLANDMPNTGEDPFPVPPKKPKPQVDTASDDLAVEPRPDPDKPKASWAGTVTLADSAGSKKTCPRKGQAVFAVTRAAPGNFKYKLSCSNGQGFSGTAVSYSQGGPNFEAYGAHDLKINRTRTIQCTLQEVKPSGARATLDKGSFAYTCNNPAFEPQADDLATPQRKPKPTHAQKKPEISIFCKPGFRLNGKTCVKKPVVSILCAKGFKLEGQRCVRKPVIGSVKPRRAAILR